MCCFRLLIYIFFFWGGGGGGGNRYTLKLNFDGIFIIFTFPELLQRAISYNLREKFGILIIVAFSAKLQLSCDQPVDRG